jgi:hypothetical protein
MKLQILISWQMQQHETHLISQHQDLLAATSHKYLKAIREARKQAKAGKLFTHEQVFGKL